MKEERYNPNYLGTAKFLFVLISIAVLVTTIVQCINLVWMLITPGGNMTITNTGYSYKLEELIGHTNLSYEFLGISSSTVLTSSAKAFGLSSGIVFIALHFIPQLAMLLIGYKIISSLHNSHTPFTQKIIHYLRALAFIMIAFGLVSQFLVQLIITLVNFQTPPDVDFVAIVEWGYVMAGVMILVISETFSKGYELQDEVDTTL